MIYAYEYSSILTFIVLEFAILFVLSILLLNVYLENLGFLSQMISSVGLIVFFMIDSLLNNRRARIVCQIFLPLVLAYFILTSGMIVMPEDQDLTSSGSSLNQWWNARKSDWAWFTSTTATLWCTKLPIFQKVLGTWKNFRIFIGAYPGAAQTKAIFHKMNRIYQLFGRPVKVLSDLDKDNRRHNFVRWSADFKWLRDHPIFGQFDSQPNTWYSHYGLKPTHLQMRWNRIFTSLDPYKDNFINGTGGERLFQDPVQSYYKKGFKIPRAKF